MSERLWLSLATAQSSSIVYFGRLNLPPPPQETTNVSPRIFSPTSVLLFIHSSPFCFGVPVRSLVGALEIECFTSKLKLIH